MSDRPQITTRNKENANDMTTFGKPQTYADSLALLKADQEKDLLPRPEVSEGMLPLEVIRYADRVFQPRTFEGQYSDHQRHIKVLEEAIRNTPGHRLNPIIVWWSGARWIVIDGHHRLAAYRNVARSRKRAIRIEAVPVEVFEGGLMEAIAKSTELNSEDKLPMSKHDKTERAWKLVAHQDPKVSSLRKIAKITGVSKSLVGIMMKRLKELQQEQPDADPLNMTWKEARTGQQDRTVDEDWIERQHREFARRLGKEFGPNLIHKAAIVAGGIEYYSEGLPRRLAQEWEMPLEDDFDRADDFDEEAPDDPFVNDGEEEVSDF